MKSNTRGAYLLILATFFVSGVAGLLYQVVWTRYLALFLGHTSYAVVAVLAAFMGGLALGNAWLGAKVDRLRRPLFFYAALEAGIGFYAVLFPRYYEWIHDLFLGVVRSVHPEGGSRLALQFLFAGVTILFPTVLMGATLPALTRYVTRSLGELRGKVAALYAINSTGAVVGVVLSDWWWIPTLGLETVVYLGAAMSLSIALVTYVVSARTGDLHQDSGSSSQPADDESFSPLELKVALVSAGISGFVAMLYEIAWTRLLGLALGSSTHAYSLMLATFISGIAVGSWLISGWKRRWNTLTAFAVAELALAGTLFVSMWFYDLLPFWFSRMSGLLARRPEAYPLYEACQGVLCFLVMFGPAVCLGMTLPLVSRVATAEISRTGRSVGRVFAVNTLGTVLGAALTGLWLLPRLGLAATFAFGVGLNILIGLAVLGARRGSMARFLGAGAVATLALTSVASAYLDPRWTRGFLLGLWRDPRPPATVDEYRARTRMFALPYFKDGAGSTVAVIGVDDPDTGGRELSLRVNGKSDASSGDDMSTQLLAGHIPMLLHPNAVNALVVGAGSGVTVGSLLQHPTVTNVDLVEISPEVRDAARDHFHKLNHDALRNPRCRTVIEDAKTFLKTTPHRYDVIVTEPSNPWMAGVAAVFSREYYEDCRERLAPGGIAAQWVQTYETDDATFETVVATFGSVFPHLSLWHTSVGDLLLVGTVEPFKADLEAMAGRLAVPAVAADLEQIEVTRLVNVLSLQVTGLGDAFHLVRGETRIHSDFLPVLEYRAQKAFFVRGSAGLPDRINELQNPRPRTLLGEHILRNPLTTNDCRALALQFSKMGIPELPYLRSILDRWKTLAPGDTAPHRLLSSYSIRNPAPDGDAARTAGDPFFRNDDRLADLALLRTYADMLLLKHRVRRSAFHVPSSERLEQILGVLTELDPDNQRMHRARLAEVCWDRGQDDRARKLFEQAMNPDQKLYGPIDFKKDAGVLSRMMSRLVDSEIRAGRVQRALEMAAGYGRLGFLTPDLSTGDEYLNMLVRRAIAMAQEPPPRTTAPMNPAVP